MSRKDGYHDLFARIPETLWEALRDEASRENRSATAQLIRLLRERYEKKLRPKKN